MEDLITLLMVKLHRSRYNDGSSDESQGLLTKIHSLSALKGLEIFVTSDISVLSNYWSKYFTPDLKYSVRETMASLRSEAQDFTRRICELCKLFRIDLSQREVDHEYEKYLLLALYGGTIKQLKYSVNLVNNLFWAVELPDSFAGAVGIDLFPRVLKVWLKRHITSKHHRRSLKIQQLVNTLFMGYKKGLLPVRPDAIQTALEKHEKALTKDPSISDALSDDVQRVTKSLVQRLHLKIGMTGNNKQSTSSTREFSYSDGGNVGMAKQSRRHPDDNVVRVPEFVGFVMERDIRQRTTSQENVPEGRKRRWSHDIRSVYAVDPLFYEDIREEVFQLRMDKGAIYSEPVVSPACILEPMKVRIITKPDVGLHVDLHKFQHSVWDALYRHKSRFFQLIGEPVERLHLWDVVAGWQPGEKFCSGDYSAATDNLKGEVSEIILKELFGQFAFTYPIEYQNIMNSMLHSRVDQESCGLPSYEGIWENFQYQLHTFDQTNGQLMGNVISFVVLCIANYVAYHLSVERFKGLKLHAFDRRIPHVKINGDDILFKTTDAHYAIWTQTVKEFGFEPSVGKNFLTDRFLQINSVLYRLDTVLYSQGEKAMVKDLVKVDYVNFGLITNRKKQDCSKDYSIVNTRVARPGYEIPSRRNNSDVVSAFLDMNMLLPDYHNITCDGDSLIRDEVTDSLFELQSVLGRLIVLPTILEKLENGLCKSLVPIVRTLSESHYHPLLERAGLLGVPIKESLFQIFITNSRESTSLELEPFNEQGKKLDRGTLNLEYDVIRSVRRQISRTGGLSLIDIDCPVIEPRFVRI